MTEQDKDKLVKAIDHAWRNVRRPTGPGCESSGENFILSDGTETRIKVTLEWQLPARE